MDIKIIFLNKELMPVPYSSLIFSYYSVAISLEGHFYVLFRRGKEKVPFKVSDLVSSTSIEGIDRIKAHCQAGFFFSLEEIEEHLGKYAP